MKYIIYAVLSIASVALPILYVVYVADDNIEIFFMGLLLGSLWGAVPIEQKMKKLREENENLQKELTELKVKFVPDYKPEEKVKLSFLSRVLAFFK